MKNGTTFALSRIQVSEFFYQGDGDYLAHTWIIKPSFLREIATYPFAFYLVPGWGYIETSLPYVDTDRAIAIGASYGGYLTCRIQAHDLGRKFKAIFTHDGSFNALSQNASEQLWLIQHNFNGTLCDNFKNYGR
ncbi:hypothetical protein F5882DRAFT_463252 [Hyaloscypha sp. PMI_1271]|nr:hypothetical protein F5882DRAFT_463252 [Hyaloscypha sp. PMI_1271]